MDAKTLIATLKSLFDETLRADRAQGLMTQTLKASGHPTELPWEGERVAAWCGQQRILDERQIDELLAVVTDFRFKGRCATADAFIVASGMKRLDQVSDLALSIHMDDVRKDVAATAALVWMRRYPLPPVGNKAWAASAHAQAQRLLAAL